MRSILKGALALSAAMTGQAVSAPAAAQQADTVAQEEIVVTVQKREQALLDVPIALNALTGRSLERFGIDEFEDLGAFVPGLEVQNQSPNNPGYVLRGITTDDGDSFEEPRVAIFQDGISISKSRGSYVELFDIARVEVAKGPQATLFGRGALIGAISVVQNKARLDDFSVDAAVAGGDEGYRKAQATVNIPLVNDQLGLRISGVSKERDGYVQNLLGGDLQGVDTNAQRVALRLKPAEYVTFDLIYNHQEEDAPGTAFKSGTFTPLGGSISPYSAAALNVFGGFEGGKQLGLERRSDGITFISDWDVRKGVSLVSTTGARWFDSYELFDPDGSQYTIAQVAEDARGNQFSHDMRLVFETDGPVSGFVGAGYFQEEGDVRVPLAAGQAAGTLLGGAPAFVPLFPSSTSPFIIQREEYTNFSETKSYDLYADATWSVTERFDLTGGVRWTRDEKETRFIGDRALQSLPIALLSADTNGVTLKQSLNSEGLTWRFVGKYALSETAQMWASYARGRRPEVLSVTPTTGAFSRLPSEEVDSFEVGAKARLFGGAVQLDGSVFHYEYENFQTTQRIGANLVTINAGEASADGFEGQLNWKATSNLNLLATYAYNHGRFESGARDGNKFRLSPDHSAALAADWRLPVGPGAVFFTPSYTWQSKVFFDDDNDRSDLQVNTLNPALSDTKVDEFQDAYGLLNAKLGYEHESGKWSINGFVTNALDEEFLIDAGNTGDSFGIATFIAGPPRLVGVELKGRF